MYMNSFDSETLFTFKAVIFWGYHHVSPPYLNIVARVAGKNISLTTNGHSLASLRRMPKAGEKSHLYAMEGQQHRHLNKMSSSYSSSQDSSPELRSGL